MGYFSSVVALFGQCGLVCCSSEVSVVPEMQRGQILRCGVASWCLDGHCWKLVDSLACIHIMIHLPCSINLYSMHVHVKLHALANTTESLNWWKGASTIHLYTSTPPLTCDGRRESQHVDTDRRRENQHVDTNGRRESQHVDTKGGNSNFTINCENQDSNSRPWALIPC
jgi:hypothetical protein